MMRCPSSLKPLLIVGGVYLYGLFLGGLLLAWQLFTRGSMPSWSRATYAVTPLFIGGAAMVLESIGDLILGGDRVTDPLWKRASRVLALIAVLLGGIAIAVTLNA